VVTLQLDEIDPDGIDMLSGGDLDFDDNAPPTVPVAARRLYNDLMEMNNAYSYPNTVLPLIVSIFDTVMREHSSAPNQVELFRSWGFALLVQNIINSYLSAPTDEVREASDETEEE